MTDGRLEDARAAIDTAAEERLGLVESGGHAGILRTLPGKHEGDGPINNRLNCGESFGIAQQCDRTRDICVRERNCAAIFKWPPAEVERVRRVGQGRSRDVFPGCVASFFEASASAVSLRAEIVSNWWALFSESAMVGVLLRGQCAHSSRPHRRN